MPVTANAYSAISTSLSSLLLTPGLQRIDRSPAFLLNEQEIHKMGRVRAIGDQKPCKGSDYVHMTLQFGQHLRFFGLGVGLICVTDTTFNVLSASGPIKPAW